MKKLLFLFMLLVCPGCGALYTLAPGGQPVAGRLPGFRFYLESCYEAASEGKVCLTFGYVHRLAPQSVTLVSGSDTYAVDYWGNRYAVGYAGDRSVRRTPPGTAEKVTLEIRDVPPGIEAFRLVCCRVKAAGGEAGRGERSTVLRFRDVAVAR